MRSLATIGVYGFTARTFHAALDGFGVTVLLDVRQRRGVRGAEYAWANAVRLQALLSDAGIDYRHWSALAPTTELRELQYAADARRREGKRSRSQLSPTYRDAYIRQILDRVDLAHLIDELPADAVGALFCVERDAAACHRSIVAARFADEYRLGVVDLVP